MKITPLEIRQKDFEKKLRGYDKDEVNAFLLSLSNEWERVIEDNKELNLKLRQSEKEVEKLREVESSLYKTLKTAEETGANVIDQANKAAELHMKDTQMNAEALLSESKNKARAMIEQAEVESRHIIDELQEAVKMIEQRYRELENHREIALHELKNLSVTLIEKVERSSRETKEINFEDYSKRVKALARESDERIKEQKMALQPSIERTEKAVQASKELNIEGVPAEPQPVAEPVTEPTPEPEPQPVAKVEEPPAAPPKMRTVEVERPKPNLAIKKTVAIQEDEEVAAPEPAPRKVVEPKVEVPKKEAPKKEEKEEPASTKSFFDELDFDED